MVEVIVIKEKELLLNENMEMLKLRKVRWLQTKNLACLASKRKGEGLRCVPFPNFLFTSTYADYIRIGILSSLFSEVVTRLSEVCCQQVVENGALPVIFKVIKKCNRSLPHLEVIKYSLSILYNVAKVTGFGSEDSPPLLHWKVGVEI